MNFENYKVNDFLMDESFHNWVKNPNSEDGIFWESWLNDHPDKQLLANQAKKVIRAISFKDKSFKKEEITDLWDRIRSETVSKGNDKISVAPNQWKYLKVAAVILPFIIAAVLFLFFRDLPDDKVVTQVLIEKHNPKGHKSTIFLSDGSKVILNAASDLSYHKPFDKNQREVHLEGEAYFEVTQDKKRPFIVRSGNIETKVIGTSFNVEAYADDRIIKVAVKSGVVSVENKEVKTSNNQNKSIVLSPLEMAVYSRETNKTMVTDYNPAVVLGWSEGTLHFQDASMKEFVTKLERWYGVDFIIERQTPVVKGITGTYRDETLEEILMGHKEASEFDYEFLTNGKVLIK